MTETTITLTILCLDQALLVMMEGKATAIYVQYDSIL